METLKKLYNKIIEILKNAFKRKAKGEKKELTPKQRLIRKGLKAVLLTGVLTCLFCGLALAWYAFIYVDDEFDLSTVDSSLNYTSVVYGLKDGAYVEAETLHASENRIWANIDDIPDDLQHAFVAIEDERFYKHSGVDLKRTLAAVLNFVNVASDDTFGGSTITQQVIKNLSGEAEQTVSRKVQEIRRAWYVEREYKKDQILEVYMNTIFLSDGCYGVQTAAEHYFSKSLDELTLLECASIASITNRPTHYNPAINPENNMDRTRLVLKKMLQWEYITQEEYDAAMEEELKLNISNSSNTNETGTAVNSYFVDQVIEDVVEALVKEKGYSESYAYSLVYSGGIQIYSTMDVNVQNAIDEFYKDPENFPKITSKVKINGETVTQTPQSAMVIIDNQTGAVAGMAGGIGEKSTARGLNRATQSFLQPGSCMKPIGTYGPAIEYGATLDGAKIAPGTLVLDKGVEEKPDGTWWPKNYDVVTEKMMSVQAAVNNSTNTVAVRVNQALGAKTAFNFLKNNLGVTTLVPGAGNDENASSMALGGLTKGINVLEITAAYAAFPNEGTYIKPYTFTKVCDQNGRVILENRVETNTAMKTNTARMVNQMLHTAATVGTGTVGRIDGQVVAGKTGTTTGDKDRWYVGYTGYYTAGVWFGYDKPDTVVYGGRNPAGVTFQKVMSKVHEGLPAKGFTGPSGLTTAEVCAESGKVPTDKCVTKVSGQFFADSLPGTPCDVCGVVDPNAPADPNAPVTPGTPDPKPETPETPQEPVKPEDPSNPEETPDPKPETPEEKPEEIEKPDQGGSSEGSGQTE